MRVVSTFSAGVRHVLSVGLQALLVAAIIGTLALFFSGAYKPASFVAGVQDAAAGRGAASLDASPHDVAKGQKFMVRGQGYDPNKQTWVKVETSSSTGWYSATVSSAGEISLPLELWTDGRASLEAYQVSGGRARPLANCWITVQ